MFNAEKIGTGIYHVADSMGVCMTLIEGDQEAILIDAGYGLEDVRAFMRTLTGLPVRLILTHGHHDHVLGARWFERSWLHPADMDEFLLRTGVTQRERVKKQAQQKGIPVRTDFLTASIPMPESLILTEQLGPFACQRMTLGSREVWMIHVPGHTPGSMVAFLPEERLLLTGDDWNPCTWLWFPSSVGIWTWKENMTMLLQALEAVAGCPIDRVLCSHQPCERAGTELYAYLDAITEERVQSARPVEMNSPIHTFQIVFPRPEWTLVFDREKSVHSEKMRK